MTTARLGISSDVGGDVHARTQNGSVRMGIPNSYAAQIETGTVNGRRHSDSRDDDEWVGDAVAALT